MLQELIKRMKRKSEAQRQGNNDGRTGTKGRIRCWLHNVDGSEGEHPIWRCHVFSKITVKERQSLVKVNNACQRCLEIGCPGAKELDKCRRNFKCMMAGCGGYHDRLLHSRDGSTMHAIKTDNNSGGDPILPIQNI